MAVFSIVGVVQKYEWGKKGNQSEVARLYSSSVEKYDVDANTPYAELWLGTHVKAPSRVEETKEELGVWLKKSAEAKVGNGSGKEGVIGTCDGQLPFLLKVLSIDKSLSIQIHPNKSEAGMLHLRDPYNYPDANHKPEMTIALTTFEALCSFRPLPEIIKFIRDIEDLRELVTTPGTEQQVLETEAHLEVLFRNLMTSDTQKVQDLATKLYQKIKNKEIMREDQALKLFVRLMDQHPGDVGCFCVFFLNHITLQPGQSLFLRSNLPHAYISGDCIECMATSDNVVRAGLTPKFRDVETLCRLVDYTSMTPSQVLFTPSLSSSSSIHPGVTLYDPPVPEFAVEKIELPSTFETFQLPLLSSHSILLLIKGCLRVTAAADDVELVISSGKSLFIEADCRIVLAPGGGVSGADAVLAFRAYSTGV